MNQDFYSKLAGVIPEDRIRQSELLSNHTTFRIGGPADYFVTVHDTQELTGIFLLCKKQEIPFFVIGNGSNLLVSDQGYRGVVIRMAGKLNEAVFTEAEDGIHAVTGAGKLLSQFACEAIRHGAGGFAYAAGIPGSVGGAVYMNAGAYGGEIKQHLVRIHVISEDGSILAVPAEQLELGYRYSVLQQRAWYVVDAEFVFGKADVLSEMKKADEFARLRRDKQPLEYPSAGSTFKRPDGFFAGKLIMDAGLAGFRVGGAEVSAKHCGFVINAQKATAKDVFDLIGQVQARVQEQFGVRLEPEIRMLGDF